ncbi:MAG: hypothetical protein ACM31P_09885 [Actinomycetota bacterium]
MDFASHRFILAHKQTTSARVRFLRLPDGVLAPNPLPAGSIVPAEAEEEAVPPSPAPLMRSLEMHLGLPLASLQPAEDFLVQVETPEGAVTVLLAAFTSIDPPFAAAERLGGSFVAIIEARGLPAIEQQLLRRAYEYLLG